MLYYNNKIFRIPNEISIIYFKKVKILVLKYQFKIIKFNIYNFVKLKNKIVFFYFFNFIIFYKIKIFLFEINNIINFKLKLIGVGFKILRLTKNQNIILLFKIGFSHYIFLKIPKKIWIYSLRFINLIIQSSFYIKLIKLLSVLKLIKIPDIYKGKGILCYNQKIILKVGKKN